MKISGWRNTPAACRRLAIAGKPPPRGNNTVTSLVDGPARSNSACSTNNRPRPSTASMKTVDRKYRKTRNIRGNTYGARVNTRLALVPPKPNEFDNTVETRRSFA